MLKQNYLFLASTFVIGIFIYWPGLSGPFLLDDNFNVLPTVPQELNWTEIFRILSSNHSSPTGRPVTVLTFILNSYYSGLSPYAFKCINLFIHIINSILIGIFIRQLFLITAVLPIRESRLVAFSTAVLWLTHPLQVSTVLYVVQRMTQLSCLFTLLSLINYLAIRQQLLKGGNLPLIHTISLGGCMLLAVLSKENGALVALYIPLIEFYFFKLKTKTKRQKQYLFGLLGIFSILPIFLAGIYFYTRVHHYLMYLDVPFPSRGWSIYERLLSEANVLVYYLHNITIPNLDNMSLFLDSFPVTRSFDSKTAFSSAILMLLFTIAIATIKKAPVLSFGILFYFTGHLLESTIHPLELAFEHRNYLPILGPVLIFCYYIFKSKWISSLQIKLLFVLLLTITFSIMTWIRCYEWGDSIRIYQNAIQKQPLSVRAHAGLINALLTNKRLEEAREILKYAEKLPGNSIGFTIHRAQTYCTETNTNTAEAILAEAINRIPNSFITGITHESINTIQLRKMSGECPAISYDTLQKLTAAAISNPRYVNDPLGRLSLLHARSLNLAGKHQEAIYYYKQALIKTTFRNQIPQIWLELGVLQLKLNKINAASESLESLKQLHNPPYTDTSSKSKRLQFKINEYLTSLQKTKTPN